MKRGRKRTNQDGETCLVCNDQSTGIHFGVRSCSSCKLFFRRNALKLGIYEYHCMKDGYCSINRNTRRLCNCCRLAKCFQMGMNRNLIQTDRQKFNRIKRIESNSIVVMKTSSLSFNDQTILTNIFHAYHRTCISSKYDEQLNNKTLSLTNLLNSVSPMYICLIDYFKLIPQFHQLPMDTKICLLKNNFTQIFRLNYVLVMHATQMIEDANTIALRQIFPEDLYAELCICAQRIFPFIYDPIFLKILFIILICSSRLSSLRYDPNEPLIDTKAVYIVQNFYVEIFWQYLLDRCSNTKETIRVFSSFIMRLLRSQIVHEKLTNFIRRNMDDDIEPIIRSMWFDERQI